MPLPINVLIACTNAEEQKALAGIVHACGMKPVCCSSLQEAREFLGRREFHVVFCQETLPDGGFREIVKQVAGFSEEIPVIVLSDFCDWDAFLRAMREGAYDYVACPSDYDVVAPILWRALRDSKRHIPLAVTAA
jgi:DNA-binding NtrC family response regulator